MSRDASPTPLAGRLRIALDRDLQAALEALDRSGERPDDAVHEARRALKRARAVLRLLRPAIGEIAFSRANARLRDAARPLSALRDSRVLRDTLHALRKRGRVGTGSTARLEFSLARQHVAAAASLHAVPGTLDETVAAIRAVRRTALAWKPGARGSAGIGDALRRIYRRGRRALTAAQGRPSAATLHELRKQAKYLAHALRALDPKPRRLVRKLTQQARTLGDVLGEEHDLAVLSRRAGANRSTSGADARDLGRTIAAKRERLARKALTVGARLYAEKPRDFAARVAEALGPDGESTRPRTSARR